MAAKGQHSIPVSEAAWWACPTCPPTASPSSSLCHWSPCCDWNVPSLHLPQGLGTCCSLHLQHSFTRCPCRSFPDILPVIAPKSPFYSSISVLQFKYLWLKVIFKIYMYFSKSTYLYNVRPMSTGLFFFFLCHSPLFSSQCIAVEGIKKWILPQILLMCQSSIMQLCISE